MDQTPTEYFKELVESALSRQQLRANELTSYYLVDLLCRFVGPGHQIPWGDDAGEPLALRLGRALDSGGLEQRAGARAKRELGLRSVASKPDSRSSR